MNIYTHAGRFHADEVMAVAILQKWADIKGEECEVFRLTDISRIPNDGIVLDIGREYNHFHKRYDHHHESLTRPNGYPLATAGLVWKHYGQEIVYYSAMQTKTWGLVDRGLIQGIDAHDADSAYKVEASCVAGEVKIKTLSEIIRDMNPADTSVDGSEFDLAVKFAGLILTNQINVANRTAIDHKLIERTELSATRSNILYMILDESVGNWHEPVIELGAKFIIMPSSHPGNPVSLFATPVSPGSRELQQPIERPDWFNGFIHNGKWIAGCRSVDEAVKLIESQPNE